MTTREQAIGKTLEQIDALKIDWESYYPIMENQDGQLICTGIVDGHYPNEFNDGNWSICGDDAYAMADAPDSEETFHGANYTIRYTSAGQYFISHPQGSETFDSFEELAEAHPVTEESRKFFFGDTDNDDTTVCNKTIQIDRSGVGHNWQTIDYDDIPANIVEEIEGEIIDGKQDSCADFVASNGMHYRWS